MDVIIDDGILTSILHNPSDTKELLSKIIGLVSSCKKIDDISVTITEDFYKKKLHDVINFDRIFSKDSIYGEYADFYRELASLVQRIPKYSVNEHLTDQNIDIDSAFDYPYILTNSRYPGLITTNDTISDLWWNNDNMFLLNDDLKFYIRFYLLKEDVDAHFLWSFFSHAYPNLFFNQDYTEKDFDRFGFEINEIKNWMLLSFNFLNDHALELYLKSPGSYIASAAAYGVNTSPESANTKKNVKAFSTRMIDLGGHKLCCEWHTKFHWNFGRIHYHFGNNLNDEINIITKGKVVIGIFCNHLPI